MLPLRSRAAELSNAAGPTEVFALALDGRTVKFDLVEVAGPSEQRTCVMPCLSLSTSTTTLRTGRLWLGNTEDRTSPWDRRLHWFSRVHAGWTQIAEVV